MENKRINSNRETSAIAHGYKVIPQVEDETISKLDEMKKTPSGDFNAGYNKALEDIKKLIAK